MTSLPALRIRCLLSLGLLAGASQAAADGQTYRDVLKSTTWIIAKTDGETSTGTGVLVDADRRLVITNKHVVGDARQVVVFFPDMEDGLPIVERSHYLKNAKTLAIRGTVVAGSREKDLAIVELERLPKTAAAIPLAAKGTSPGEEVQSIGNPGATDALWVYTSGTVRSVYRKRFKTEIGLHDFRVVETQSPINSGDSGGPVVNEAGQLVAISQAVSQKARLVSFCVSLSELKTFLASDWKPAPLTAAELLAKADLPHAEHASGHLVVTYASGEPVAADDATKADSVEVFLGRELDYHDQADIRRVWSLVARLDAMPSADSIADLLIENGQTKLGAYSLERTESGEVLVMFTATVDASAAPSAVGSTMGYVAKITAAQADRFGATTESAPQPELASDTLDQWLGN